MKIRTKLILFFILFSSFSFAQIQKEIDNDIFVTFPNSPKYIVKPKGTAYVAKTDNCIFMVLVSRLNELIPNYTDYMIKWQNWSQSKIQKEQASFLDEVVKGKLNYTNNKKKGIVKNVKIGKYNGRTISYSAVNPATGERNKRFSIMILVKNKIISFECWYLKDNGKSEREKNKFLNTIKVK